MKRRNILIVVLIVIVIALGSAAAYIAIQLNNANTANTNISGVLPGDLTSQSDKIRTSLTLCSDTCHDPDGCNCNATCSVAAVSNGYSCGVQNGTPNNTKDTVRGQVASCGDSCQDPDGCTCPSSCQITSTVVYQGKCGFKASATQTALSDCSATCSNSAGCTCLSTCVNAGSVGNGAACGGTKTTSTTGSNTASNSGSNSGSNNTTTSISKKQCGQSCNSTADCAAPTNGGTATCRSGVCENAACPAGKSQPGANCDCTALNACGSPCSASLGLCQAGSTCSNVGGASCPTTSGGLSGLYCLPTALPAGWTTRNCPSGSFGSFAALLNGAIPTQAQIQATCQATVVNTAVTTTCYRCTAALSDSNACESFTINGGSCPAGSTDTANACAASVGGSCPTTTSTNITCYACSDSLTDGNACSPFTSSGTSCPTGSSTSSAGCAGAFGGSCPVAAVGTLPNTGLFDNGPDIILGLLFIVLGFTVFKYWRASVQD